MHACVHVCVCVCEITFSDGKIHYTQWKFIVVYREKNCLQHFPNVRYFWYETAVWASDNIGHAESFNWRLFLCLLAAWIIIYLCLFRGINWSGKVGRCGVCVCVCVCVCVYLSVCLSVYLSVCLCIHLPTTS